jgi:murein DD-endopeptidase MepM/ murein hydrolase activator NlpD
MKPYCEKLQNEVTKMRKRYIGIIVVLLSGICFFSNMLAKPNKQTVRLDNEFFQTYNEHLGRWIILSESRTSLENLLGEVGSSVSDLRNINSLSPGEPIPTNRPLFLPYSETYSKELLAQGKGRETIVSDFRELVWPVGTKNSKISSRLGIRRNVMHNGVDIACPHKSPILAAADGVVISSRFEGAYGYSLKIQHSFNQIQTLYAHNTVLLVKEGEKVTKGQIIAFSGSTGHSTGPHLHFEVRYQSVILNPEHYFANSLEEEKVAIKE